MGVSSNKTGYETNVFFLLKVAELTCWLSLAVNMAFSQHILVSANLSEAENCAKLQLFVERDVYENDKVQVALSKNDNEFLFSASELFVFKEEIVSRSSVFLFHNGRRGVEHIVLDEQEVTKFVSLLPGLKFVVDNFEPSLGMLTEVARWILVSNSNNPNDDVHRSTIIESCQFRIMKSFDEFYDIVKYLGQSSMEMQVAWDAAFLCLQTLESMSIQMEDDYDKTMYAIWGIPELLQLKQV
jgi:hypothetical protein